jgi:TRAP-type C4-dicarboxylate transport system permease small subunit
MQTGSGLPENRIGTALRYLMGLMLLAAIVIMLIGVTLRYLVGPISDKLNLGHIDFFWVEETGELLLGWLTFVGAGIGILERTHFGITLLIDKLSPGKQRLVHYFNMALAAIFGLVLAWQGWKLAVLNAPLTTPALEISMGWMYAGLVAGGILMAACALIAAVRPIPPSVAEHADS